MRWPKPMIRSLRASASATHFSASPIAATASSIRSPRARAARGLRDDRQRDRGQAAEVLLRLVVVDVDQLAELPLAAEARERGLQVRHVAAGAVLELLVGRGKAGLQRPVDEQPPDLLEGN